MSNSARSPVTVAVIEDEAPIREMYRFKLAKEGFTVVTAANGAEGLFVCQGEKPNLILLDLRMPVMSGDDMLAQLRQTPEGANVRVIILTNISKDEAPHNLRLLNVDRYVVKAHHTPAQVVQIVKEILNISE